MTQVNITLSHEEVLQVLSGNRDDAFKLLVTRILNAVMLAESEEQLGASMHERTEGRQDYRNGNPRKDSQHKDRLPDPGSPKAPQPAVPHYGVRELPAQ